MFLKLNLKRKINLTIISLKSILFILAILIILFFKDLGIVYTSIIGAIAIIGLVLLQKLSGMFDKLLEDYLENVLQNNSLISSNILDAILSQSTFTEKNKNVMDDIANCVDRLKIDAYTTKDIVQTIIEKTQKTLMLSSKEENFIKESIEKMVVIKQKIQIIAELILELSEQAQHISNNIGVVEDIAEQTNMLALNAAVEAARAGEHGKGFAVVASEIRKLADESKQATTKIIELVREVQNATNSTVMAAEESSKEIETGVNITVKINENINELKLNIDQTADDVYKILSAMNSQFDNAEYISQTAQFVSKEMKDVNAELKDKIQIVQKVLDSANTVKTEIAE